MRSLQSPTPLAAKSKLSDARLHEPNSFKLSMSERIQLMKFSVVKNGSMVENSEREGPTSSSGAPDLINQF